MLRRTPLKRRKPMRRGRPKPTAYRRRVRNLPYMAWIRAQACAARWMGGCRGRIEADHAGERPVGRKADDLTCIPLCHTHHVQRGSFSGPFRSWNRAGMREWLDAGVLHYQRMYVLHGAK